MVRDIKAELKYSKLAKPLLDGGLHLHRRQPCHWILVGHEIFVLADLSKLMIWDGGGSSSAKV